MPTYEYECRACGFSFERVQNMSEDPVRDCPECGKAVRRIIFGGSGVIFKGSGFYVNDSRGKNPAAPSTAKSAESGSPSGSDSPGAQAPKKAEAAPSSPAPSGDRKAKGDSGGGSRSAAKETA